MKRLLGCVSSLVLIACGQGSALDRGGSNDAASSSTVASASAAPPKVFAGKKTAELALRPEVLEAALALSGAKSYESKFIGAGGSPSDTYALFETLRGRANEAELIALLEDESAIVRAYVGVHVANKVPAGLPALVRLGADSTMLSTLRGCIGGGTGVSILVVEALCASELEQAPATLLAIHAAGGWSAADALACAAPFAGKQSSAAALEALRAGPKPAQKAAYLRVLAVAPAPAAEQCPVALAASNSDDASVVIAAAMALWRCEDEPSKQRLSELAAGKNVVVARQARASMLLQRPEQYRPADEYEAMYDVDTRLREALRGTDSAPVWLPLVSKLIEADPKRLAGSLASASVSPEMTELVLRLVAGTASQRELGGAAPRSQLLRYLARSKDPRALSELRRSLKSDEPNELASALRGLALLRDKASRPRVEQLTKHAAPAVAEAAREALQQLK